MKVLSVRQCWAWAIFHAGKDVENRTWRTHYRGPLGIHASGRGTPLGRELREMRATLALIEPTRVPPKTFLLGILGVVELVDVMRDSRSAWAVPGCWHWVLRNARLLAQPIPRAGGLSLWEHDLDGVELLPAWG
jgi:hypothetical protein